MMPYPLFSSLPTVSKSLLRVLGTFQKAAVSWAMESAVLWKTKACFPQDLDNPIRLTTLPTAPMSTAIIFSKPKDFCFKAREEHWRSLRLFCYSFYHLVAPFAWKCSARARSHAKRLRLAVIKFREPI